MDPVMKAIHDRRSIRKYTNQSISNEQVESILEAGRWAPSGLNNQPWSFVVINTPEALTALSKLTEYSRILQGCNACICVFYNLPDGYNRDKDLMSIGACIQNMLLVAHTLGIGSVWLGEILNRKNDVHTLLGVDDNHELMAVIALGYPAESPRGKRKKLSSLVVNKQ